MGVSTLVSDNTRNQYRRRGYGTLVGVGKSPAIIVVDFQRSLTEHDRFPLAWNYDAEVEATRQLIEAGREASIPIVFTAIGYESGGMDGGILVRKIPGLVDFKLDSEWVEIDKRIAPQSTDYVVVKRMQSAFFGTMLHTYLTVRQVDTVLIAGCTTSGCVRATVTDACSWGFRVMLVPECIGDQAPEPHEQNLFDMQAKNGDLFPLKEAISYLRNTRAPARSAQPAGHRADP
jgi:maleamate amidohydrolase